MSDAEQMREAALNAELLSETVNVPQWGGKVVIREADVTPISKLLLAQDEDEPVRNLAELIVLCAYTESGERIFQDGDADALMSRGVAAILAVGPVAKRINGLTDDAQEEIAGNSDAT